ncbi:MAG: hypothetical protein K2G88_01800 [Oscillospiraceae bacterium]|nr:hypothetical protein [Oscillospiraceae bacterium]
MKHKFDVQKLFNDFKYPNLFLKIIQLGLVDFDCWYLMNKTQVYNRRRELLIRYSNRNLIPFARRSDCDNIACFEVDAGEKVFIIHDFSSSGFEQENEFEDFKSWFLDAIAEMLENED